MEQEKGTDMFLQVLLQFQEENRRREEENRKREDRLLAESKQREDVLLQQIQVLSTLNGQPGQVIHGSVVSPEVQYKEICYGLKQDF